MRSRSWRRSPNVPLSPWKMQDCSRMPADVRQLQSALQAAGTPHRVEWYPGVQHGFVFPQREGIYDRAAAERHWERLFSLFDRRLRHR